MYLFYRTEHTLVNWVFIQVLGGEPFHNARLWVNTRVVLNGFQMYSLPEALWILSITLLSKRYILKLGQFSLQLWFLPLLVAFGFEFFQLLHWSNGIADFNDLWGAVLFWTVGMIIFPEKEPKISLFQSFNIHAVLCTATYAVVYLAHVIN